MESIKVSQITTYLLPLIKQYIYFHLGLEEVYQEISVITELTKFHLIMILELRVH